MKRILSGTTALIAVAGFASAAFAADAPAATPVLGCAAFGVGYFAIPGGDGTCIRVGGFIRDDNWTLPSASHATAGIATQITARIALSSKTNTDIGLVDTLFDFRLYGKTNTASSSAYSQNFESSSTGYNSAVFTPKVYQGYAQFAGFTVGRHETFSALYGDLLHSGGSFGANDWDMTAGGGYGAHDWELLGAANAQNQTYVNMLAYQIEPIKSVFASVSLEDGTDERGNILIANGNSAGAGTYFVDVSGKNAPISALAVTSSAGFASTLGGLTPTTGTVLVNKYTNGAVKGSNGTYYVPAALVGGAYVQTNATYTSLTANNFLGTGFGVTNNTPVNINSNGATYYNNEYGAMQVPDAVFQLRQDGSWGQAMVSATLHQVNLLENSNTAITGTTAPSAVFGYAINAAAVIAVPGVGNGKLDEIGLGAAYEKGAEKYAFNGLGSFNTWVDPNSTATPIPNTGRAVSVAIADGFVDVSNNNQLTLTKGWATNAGYVHFFTPQISVAPVLSYGKITNGSGIAAEDVAVGVLRVDYRPVNNLLVSVEGNVLNLKEEAIGTTGAASITNYVGYLRIEKDF